MRISYKYIVLAIIVFIIMYNLTSSKKEKFDVNIDRRNRIIFNADTYLKNLTEEQAKEMLVSSKTLPFVKFLEPEQAENIYNKLFVEEGNLDSTVKDIISDELDDSITITNDRLDNTEKIRIYNKILKNLNLTKSFSKKKNIRK